MGEPSADISQIVRELQRRQSKSDKQSGFWIQPTLSPLQQEFITDPARFKLARASRQSGKTFTVLQYLMYIATRPTWHGKPARCLLIGLTMKNVKMLGWDGLKDLLIANNIEHTPYEAALGISFPNGAKIALIAADQQKSIDRLRGSQWDLICVDECAFSSDADELVKVLLPTLAVRRGSIVMTSSPGSCSGFFYEADQGTHSNKWSRYAWQMSDNPVMQTPAVDAKYSNRAEEEMDTILQIHFNGDVTHPGYRREYLGQWVRDDSVLLFHYNPQKNGIYRQMIPKKLHYVAAIDLGWNDANAITVIGVNPDKREMYVVETWKQKKITIEEIAVVVKGFIDKYDIRMFGADMGGYGKGIAEELRIKHRLPVIPAMKQEKTAAIATMNSDFYMGFLKASDDLTELINEWGKIERDPDRGIEVKSAVCDLADSALYAYRLALLIVAREEQTVVQSVEEKMRTRAIEDTMRKLEDPYAEW